MFFVYVLYSDGFDRYYVGFSQNADIRLKEHNGGQNKSTKPYIPWRLVHSEEYKTRIEARTREKYLKSASGRRWRKNNINLGD
ncbi:MAG: GIY-YIG nuclease family protein [Maribacter sp.]|nr:GIY-YIG nuclease family protein [Maribacter sp.]MBT8313726.1 GIY-YIG nuclease family protein [Maribacter sp.]